MAERIRWVTSHVQALCADQGCQWSERVELPTPDQQKALIRHARQHALRTGHRPGIERAQLGGVE